MKEELKTDKNGRSTVLVPFLTGGLIGAGVMLLLAPKSGKEVRRDISDLASDTRERIVATLDKGRTVLEEGRLAVNDAVEAGKAAYLREKEKHRQAA